MLPVNPPYKGCGRSTLRAPVFCVLTTPVSSMWPWVAGGNSCPRTCDYTNFVCLSLSHVSSCSCTWLSHKEYKTAFFLPSFSVTILNVVGGWSSNPKLDTTQTPQQYNNKEINCGVFTQWDTILQLKWTTTIHTHNTGLNKARHKIHGLYNSM